MVARHFVDLSSALDEKKEMRRRMPSQTYGFLSLKFHIEKFLRPVMSGLGALHGPPKKPDATREIRLLAEQLVDR